MKLTEFLNGNYPNFQAPTMQMTFSTKLLELGLSNIWLYDSMDTNSQVNLKCLNIWIPDLRQQMWRPPFCRLGTDIVFTAYCYVMTVQIRWMFSQILKLEHGNKNTFSSNFIVIFPRYDTTHKIQMNLRKIKVLIVLYIKIPGEYHTEVAWKCSFGSLFKLLYLWNHWPDLDCSQ